MRRVLPATEAAIVRAPGSVHASRSATGRRLLINFLIAQIFATTGEEGFFESCLQPAVEALDRPGQIFLLRASQPTIGQAAGDPACGGVSMAEPVTLEIFTDYV